MSEHRYYEFQTLDRPLTAREQRELRAISSRATITPTRFANTYDWGDLKAEPAKLVERYFDAHLYVANWGTRALTLRFPKRLLDVATARRYCPGGAARARASNHHVIIDLCSEAEPPEWIDDDEDTGRLGALLSLRGDVAAGDLRALYLGWLLSAQHGDVGDDEEEPPCPPGLRTPSASLDGLIELLRIDRDLVHAAAAASADATIASRREIEAWVAGLREADRTAILVWLVEGGHPHLRADLVRRFEASRAGSSSAAVPSRTAGQLLDEAERRRDERERAESARAARERARRERKAAEARGRELDSLARREDEAWAEVAAHVATKQPGRYDDAASLLCDLRDLGARRGTLAAVEARIELLCVEHARKPAFVRRVRSTLAAARPLDEVSGLARETT